MAKKDKFTITLDDKELNKQIERALKRNPKATVKKVHSCLIDLAANSAKRAPIESADLRNDCHAELNGVTVFSNQSSAGFSGLGSLKAFGSVGYSLPYALRQHEELEWDHTRTDGYQIPSHNKRTGKPNKNAGKTVNMVAGGESKFLEKPFEERKQRYIDAIAKIPEEVLK